LERMACRGLAVRPDQIAGLAGHYRRIMSETVTSSHSGAARDADRHAADSTTPIEVARALTRVALGWFLFHQGWGKVTMELSTGLGSFYRGNQFQNNNPDWLPSLIAAPYGHVLPWAELLFGALLMLGLFNRVSAGAATLVFLSIAIAWLDAGNLLPRHMLM